MAAASMLILVDSAFYLHGKSENMKYIVIIIIIIIIINKQIQTDGPSPITSQTL
jgi:hypothetical protein